MSPVHHRCRSARAVLAALLGAALLSSCTLFGPPYAPPPGAPRTARGGRIARPRAGAQAGSQTSESLQPSPTAPGVPAAPPVRHDSLGPAARALVDDARQQERGGQYGLAAEMLERALAIEPGNPRVWLEFARERLAAGNALQANGMARKALYLATGDVSVQASAWGVIAATLRAEGQNQAALAAEQKAAQLSVQ